MNSPLPPRTRRTLSDPHVYAIVRFDLNARVTDATVVKVIPSRELDEKEAGRLNEVNKGFVESLET